MGDICYITKKSCTDGGNLTKKKEKKREWVVILCKWSEH